MRKVSAVTGVLASSPANVLHALGMMEQEPKRVSAPNGTKILPQTPALSCVRGTQPKSFLLPSNSL